MPSNVMIGYANYWKTGAATAGSSETNFEPTNLQGDQCSPSTGFQTEDGVVTSADGAWLRIIFPREGILFRGACLVNANLTSSARVIFNLYRDLGAGPVIIWTADVGGPWEGYRQVVVVADQDYTADYLEILFEDEDNPDGHINIGGAFAGPLWNPLVGLSPSDFSYGQALSSASSQARGGQRRRRQNYVQRRATIALDWIREEEAWDELGELIRVSNYGVNVLFIPDYTSVETYREAVFGELDVEPDISFTSSTAEHRKFRGTVTERL